MADLQAATRCGTGPCGGRICEEAAARLIALAAGRSRVDVGQFPVQRALRPGDSDELPGD
jgi:hypothetical protein